MKRPTILDQDVSSPQSYILGSVFIIPKHKQSCKEQHYLNLWNCVLVSRRGSLGIAHKGDRPPGSNPSCFLAATMMCPAASSSEEDTPVSMLPLPLRTVLSGTLVKINCSLKPLCKTLNPSNEKRIGHPFLCLMPFLSIQVFYMGNGNVPHIPEHPCGTHRQGLLPTSILNDYRIHCRI